MAPLIEAHCGTCKYTGFVGLQNWCRHPEHFRAIKKLGCKCNDYIFIHKKNTLDKQWVKPLFTDRIKDEEVI